MSLEGVGKGWRADREALPGIQHVLGGGSMAAIQFLELIRIRGKTIVGVLIFDRDPNGLESEAADVCDLDVDPPG